MAKQLEFTLKISGTDNQIKQIDALKSSLESVSKAMTTVGANSIAMDVLAVKAEGLQQSFADVQADIDGMGKSLSESAASGQKGLGELISTVEDVGGAIEKGLGAVDTLFSDTAEGSSQLVGDVKKSMAALGVVSEGVNIANKVSALESIAARKLEQAQIFLNTAAESQNTIVRYAAIAANKLLMASNPYGLIATAIVSVVGLMVTYNTLSFRASQLERQRTLEAGIRASAEKKVADEIAPQIAHIQKLKIVMQDQNKTMRERKAALQEYNSLADRQNQIAEKDIDNINVANAAIERQNGLLQKRAEVKALEELLSDAIKKEITLRTEMQRRSEEGTGIIKRATEEVGTFFTGLYEGNLELANMALRGHGKELDSIIKLGEATNEVRTITDMLSGSLKGVSEKYEDAEKKGVGAVKAISAETTAAIKTWEIVNDIRRKLQDEQIDAIINDQERELALANKKYSEELAELDKHLESMAMLEDENRKKRQNATPQKAAALDKEYEELINNTRDAENIIADIKTNKQIQLQKELDAIREKYRKMEWHNQQREFKEKLEQIDNNAELELMQLESDSLKKRELIKQDAAKKLITLKKANELMLEEIAGFEEKSTAITRQALEKKLALLKQQEKDLKQSGNSAGGVTFMKPEQLEMLDQTSRSIADIENKVIKLNNSGGLEKINKSFSDFADNVAKFSEGFDMAMLVFEPVFSAYNDMIGQLEELEMKKSEARIEMYQQNVETLEKKLEGSGGRQRVILEEQIKRERENLERAEMAKEKLRIKYAKIKKASDIIQATIDTTKGALNAFNSAMSLPFPINMVMAPISAGIVAGFGAAQIGIMAATPLAKGGELSGDISNVRNGSIPAGAGEITGPSHNHPSGGVHFSYGGRPFVAEGGELKTNNGDRRYIFTKGVGRDPVLRRLALATHNSSGNPVAHLVAGIVNAAGGGRQFANPMSGAMLAAGGDLTSYTQPLVPQAAIITTTMDPNILLLLEETKSTQAALKDNLAELQKRQDNLRIVLPVDKLTDFQVNERFVKESSIF